MHSLDSSPPSYCMIAALSLFPIPTLAPLTLSLSLTRALFLPSALPAYAASAWRQTIINSKHTFRRCQKGSARTVVRMTYLLTSWFSDLFIFIFVLWYSVKIIFIFFNNVLKRIWGKYGMQYIKLIFTSENRHT